MMNRAVTTGQQPGAREFVSYLTNIENNTPPPAPAPRVEVYSEFFINQKALIFKSY